MQVTRKVLESTRVSDMFISNRPSIQSTRYKKLPHSSLCATRPFTRRVLSTEKSSIQRWIPESLPDDQGKEGELDPEVVGFFAGPEPFQQSDDAMVHALHRQWWPMEDEVTSSQCFGHPFQF